MLPQSPRSTPEGEKGRCGNGRGLIPLPFWGEGWGEGVFKSKSKRVGTTRALFGAPDAIWQAGLAPIARGTVSFSLKGRNSMRKFWLSRQAHRQACRGHEVFGFANGVIAEMKDRRSEHRTRAAIADPFDEMV